MELEERERPPLKLDFYCLMAAESRKSNFNSGRKSKHSPELRLCHRPSIFLMQFSPTAPTLHMLFHTTRRELTKDGLQRLHTASFALSVH